MKTFRDQNLDSLIASSRLAIPSFSRSLSNPLRGSLILDGTTLYFGDDQNWNPLVGLSELPVFSNEGTGIGIFDNISSTPVNILLRSISSDPTIGNEGISVSLSSPAQNTLQIGNTLTGANVGTGANSAEIFVQKSGNQLQFRRLVSSAGITINQTGDTIFLSSGSGGLSGLSNETGPGVQIYDIAFSTGSTAFLRTINATTGLNISISGASGQEVINLTNTSPATSVTLSSTGGTQSLVVGSTGPSLSVKGLTSGTGITLTPSGTDLSISTTGLQSSLSNEGGQVPILDGSALRTLQGTANGLTVTQTSQTITIDNTLTGANLGVTGSSVFSNKSAAVLNFRKIIGTGGIVATENTNDITLSISNANSFTVWVISHLLPSGTNGGTATAGNNTRTLNSYVASGPAPSNVTLNTNLITVQPGRYTVWGMASACQVQENRAAFVDNGTGNIIILGGNCKSGSNEADNSLISGIIAPLVPTVYRLDHWVDNTRSTDGFGTAVNQPGVQECYVRITITQIG